jgi:hypothetical protein
MKRLLPFAAGMLIAATAHAQCPDCTGQLATAIGSEIPSDGLGAGGLATQFVWVGKSVHVYVYTGDDPEPYGSARITIPAYINSQAHPRPLCQVNGAQTGPEYTPPGYGNPYWPMVTFQTGQYTLNDGVHPTTVNITWQAAAFLQPRNTYGFVVTCEPRPQT